MIRSVFWLPLLAVCGLAPAARAASCTISATSASFGVYNTFSASPVDTTATITVDCNNPAKSNVTYAITLSAGASGSAAARYMTKGTTHLSYQLYRDAVLSQIWGDGTGGSYSVSQSFNTKTATFNHTAYGRVPAGQNVTAGSYADTVVATVTY